MTTDPNTQRAYPLAIEERRQERRQIHIAVHVTEASALRTEGTMTDVSEFGCRISAARQTVIGRLVRIEIQGFTTFAGWVVWSSGDAMGIDFSNPLRPEVVDHLEKMSESAPRRY